MKEKIETRELIFLGGLDGITRGTYHKAYDDSFGSASNLIGRHRIGVVFLNGMSATRASNGDAAVYWADSFAEHGYPSFRLDPLGLGDSDGDPPTELLGFINRGMTAHVISTKIKELAAQFNLSRVIIVGHCAGAVSAIYTAAVCTECMGLVLMDPYFDLPQTVTPEIRLRLNLWVEQSSFRGFLSNIYGLVKAIRMFLHVGATPTNANSILLRCWKELASTGLPILILKAPSRRDPGAKPRVGEFDYLKHVLRLAGNKKKVIVKVIDGASHTFSNRVGRTSVRQHTEQWLNTFFPLTQNEDVTSDTLSSCTNNNESFGKHHENCLQN